MSYEFEPARRRSYHDRRIAVRASVRDCRRFAVYFDGCARGRIDF